MKFNLALFAICFGLLLSVQSCLTCTECKRNDLEAKCIKPNDTLFFYQDMHSSKEVFNYSVQQSTDSGYICSVYENGHVSEVKGCNEAGERDDLDYARIKNYAEYRGYTCHVYKGH
jgi:hypothetical protein